MNDNEENLDTITNAESQEDVTFEEVDNEGEENTKGTIKKLREKIKILEQEKKEYLDQSMRTRADYANFKKEVEENKISDRKFATKKFIVELLPVLDAYDMAKGNLEAWEKVDKNWRMGIEYIFGQLTSILEKEGITSFGKIGDIFDPNLHESMESVTVSNEKDVDKIMRVLQSGYKLHDVILRPARVHTGNSTKEN